MLTLVVASEPAVPCQVNTASKMRGFLNTNYGWQKTLTQDMLSVSCAVKHLIFDLYS